MYPASHEYWRLFDEMEFLLKKEKVIKDYVEAYREPPQEGLHR